jgi:hypothetical protein
MSPSKILKLKAISLNPDPIAANCLDNTESQKVVNIVKITSQNKNRGFLMPWSVLIVGIELVNRAYEVLYE